MKILHVYKTFVNDTMGGVEQVIAQIAAASGLDHTVVSLSKTPQAPIASNPTVNNLRYAESVSIASNPMSVALWCDFKRLVQAFDVIHYHFPWPFADLMHCSWRIKKPTVVTYHADVVRQKKMLLLYRPLMYYFLNQVDAVVATSPNYLETSSVLQRYRHKVHVIPIGLSKENYPSPSFTRAAYWRRELGERFFLFVGVMRYYKGLHVLMAALQGTSFPVVLVGSGPLEDELKRQAQALGLTHVRFVGQLNDEDKIILFNLCGCVIFPSHLRSEAFGVSLLEGAMFGKPLISCEIGTGTSYINCDGETGCVVAANDAGAFRQAMCFIWDNPEQSERMGHRAEARYRQLFTGRQMVSQYEQLYRRVSIRKT